MQSIAKRWIRSGTGALHDKQRTAKRTLDSIGNDISKDRLDVFRLSDGASRAFDNGSEGFRALRRWLGHTPPARVVYEPTGAFHGAFERACAGHLPLCKVNPLQARGTGARSDAVDAQMLALMGARSAWNPICRCRKNSVNSRNCRFNAPLW